MDKKEFIKKTFGEYLYYSISDESPKEVRVVKHNLDQLINSTKDDFIEIAEIEKMDELTDETEKDCEQTRIWNGAIETVINAIRDSK